MDGLVRWSDDLDDVVRGDLTAAYVTPAKGTVVTAVAPCGIGQRDLGLLGFTRWGEDALPDRGRWQRVA